MIRKLLVFCLGAVLLSNTAMAHEGMWLMHMLKKINEAEMQNLGLNLTAEEIYDINNASLKDAIVMLNGGSCTGEIISSQGLVLTNHHCAYNAIQSFSTVENDILTNGFFAKTLAEEQHIDDFEISFLVRIEDVTEQVLAKCNGDMSEAERAQAVNMVIREITAQAEEGNSYNAQVKSFFYGNEYYLFVYNTYRDIRLVGNPPESIGKFGGDTDNWMWPRHTGDFSMLRVYADADNNPADYSENNVPLKPKHHLPVSMNGVKEGDFTMIMGYPGSTDRYLSSWGVLNAIEVHNPTVVAIRDMKLKTMKSHMDADPAVRLQYAAKYAQTANYWKYYIGQTKGLIRLNVYDDKKALEDQFTAWVNENETRKAEYGDALKMIKEYYDAINPVEKGNVYLMEAALQGSDIPLFAYRFDRVFASYMSIDAKVKAKEMTPEEGKQSKSEIIAALRNQADAFYKDYDYDTDKDIFTALFNMYHNNVSLEQQPSFMIDNAAKYKGDMAKAIEAGYVNSMMTSKEKLMAFLDKPNVKAYEKDPAVLLARNLIEKYRATFQNEAQDKFDRGYRLFVDGIRNMQPEKNFYPDANSTMRLTYGQVGAYDPADAVQYDFTTTTKGIMEKKDNKNPEFVVPSRLEALISKKEFGQYGDEDGELNVCFISNNDITGGNSGSPVINGDGHLIGLAFDGNWEAMSGDIAFETELQRTICVDIRYVLFIIDKYAGAGNIIAELDLVKDMPKVRNVEKVTEMEMAPME